MKHRGERQVAPRVPKKAKICKKDCLSDISMSQQGSWVEGAAARNKNGRRVGVRGSVDERDG